MTRRLAALLTATTLLSPAAALAQTPEPADLDALLARHVPKIKAKTKVPVRLPHALPEWGDTKLYSSRVATRTGWSIAIAAAPRCGSATACFVAAFDAVRGERPHYRRKVKLAGGRTGYFRGLSCGASCAPPVIQWRQNRVLYTIQAKIGGEDTEKTMMVALANEAIRAGKR